MASFTLWTVKSADNNIRVTLPFPILKCIKWIKKTSSCTYVRCGGYRIQSASIPKNVHAKKNSKCECVLSNILITIFDSIDIIIHKHTKKVYLKTRLIDNSPSEHKKMSDNKNIICAAI